MVASKTLEEEILFNYFECYMNMTRRNEIGFVVCFEQQKKQNQMLGPACHYSLFIPVSELSITQKKFDCSVLYL